MAQYILLLRGVNEQVGDYSPQELQDLFEKYDDWVESISAAGKLRAAQKLKNETKHVVEVRDGRLVDGPFAETKETIGGYFVVETDTLDEAVAIARECPVLTHGGSVELREVHTEACRYSGQVLKNNEVSVEETEV